MESEKVKEIKKALECCLKPTVSCCVDCPYNNNGRLSCLESEMLKDALNLINELESENKELQQGYIVKAYDKLRTENKQLKDLIAELEKENALIKNSVAMRDYNTLEEISNNKVKQFAERLKNKLFEFFQDNEELDGKISVGPLYVDVIGVKAKDGTIISLGLIDRLLKEYEK